MARLTEGEVVSIDLKRLCGSGEEGKRSVIHLVSALSAANEMVLAQPKGSALLHQFSSGRCRFVSIEISAAIGALKTIYTGH